MMTANVDKELTRIAAASAATFAAFSALVMSLPITDIWTNVLPSPGPYANLARVVSVFVSALIAYNVARREWLIADLATKAPPSGTFPVLSGAIIALLYALTTDSAYGGWWVLVHTLTYISIFVLTSWGLVRLAKKAFELARAKAALPNLAQRAYESALADAGLRKPASDVPTVSAQGRSDRAFLSFTASFFGALSAAVTGAAVVNEIVGVLPPVVEHSTVSAALASLMAIALIGENYTSDFLSLRSPARWSGHSAMRAGLVPAILSLVCLTGYLGLAIYLENRPPRTLFLELLAVILKIGIFVGLSFVVWRVGVQEVLRRNKAAEDALMAEAERLRKEPAQRA